jgi:hypothetical protein
MSLRSNSEPFADVRRHAQPFIERTRRQRISDPTWSASAELDVQPAGRKPCLPATVEEHCSVRGQILDHGGVSMHGAGTDEPESANRLNIHVMAENHPNGRLTPIRPR